MTVAGSTPRSLTQMLRELDDAEVTDLLIARPDLAVPAPTTFSQIASRATTRESVRAALDRLSVLDLWVAKQAATRAPVTVVDIDGLDQSTTGEILGRLRRLGLLWGDEAALRPVRALGAELERWPVDELPALEPPSFASAPRRDPEQVDQVAAGSAFELVRRTEVLIEHTDHTPLTLRQDRGLAQRELRLSAALLDLPSATAVLHVEIARSAGLLGVAPEGRHEILLPTAEFDDWQQRSLTEQWRWLARAWLEAHPQSGTAWVKSLAFEAFGLPADGREIAAADLMRWMGWHLPRLADEVRRAVSAIAAQAPWVGVTGLGALSSFWDAKDMTALDRLLPARADSVLVQNDLTAVASGPLTAEAARELGALADVESRGGATVYRFTVDSLRRAHSQGWTPLEMTTTLLSRSRTPIPQPLAYLIGDLDRSAAIPAVGGTRPQGSVGSPHHPAARRAGSVAANDQPSDSAVTTRVAERIVKRLRRGVPHDGLTDAERPVAAETKPEVPIETLREAVETGEVVWVSYVDAAGTTTERLLVVDGVDEGRLVARDSRTDDPLRIAIHRVTVAHIIRGGSV